jgi:hypothetical protein
MNADCTYQEFMKILQTFKTQLAADWKRWSSKHTDLLAKYESISDWTKAFIRMNDQIKGRIISNNESSQKWAHLISEILTLQMLKDR